MPQWKTGQCERKDESRENKLKCPATVPDVVSLLEQINKALDTWYVTTDSANMFLSTPIRKENQKCPDVRGVDDNIHLQFCLKGVPPLLPSAVI